MIQGRDGVNLGPLDEKYVETIRAWRNDPRVWSWCRQYKPISDFEQSRWFENQSKDPSIQMYAVLADDKIAGVCGFTSIDLINRRAEFSLYICPDMTQQHFGTKALKLLFSHGFKQWGFNSIWGETFDGNPAVKLFESLGMTKEGSRRQFYFRNGAFLDAHLYSVLASEWRG
jgi:RimJ/RimL family protein N-acetyltransferase